MIDTHAHLDFKDFDQDREKVISRFFEMGGKAIVNVGVDLERSRKSVEIAQAHDGVFASVGLHPEWFSREDLGFKIYDLRKNIDDLKKLADNKKIVAIGETGLDYFHVTQSIKHETQDFEKIKENQRAGFKTQIEIARELSLPVIVHCRDAWSELYKIISEAKGAKFVLHCYSGDKRDTEKFLKLPNVWFSFSGNITYPKPSERKKQFEDVIKMIPLDKIMLDSDAPFLTPQVFRGSRNEPSYIGYIAKKIAEIKQISEKEVEQTTDENAEKFFGIA